MAVAPRLQSLAGKWQIPLLVASAGLFVAGLLQLRPVVPPVTVDDVIQSVRVDLQAERYEPASRTLTTLLNETQLSNAERAEAHRLLAETIWLAESPRPRHDLTNARRILANYAVAEQLGVPPKEGDWLRIAQAADWMENGEQAVEAYRKAMQVPGADRAAILQRLIEILLAAPKRDWPTIDGYVNDLLAAAGGRPDTLLRAVQWRIQRLLAQDDVEAAQALLKSVEGSLANPPWSHHLTCFRAQILFRQEQYEAAEASLRALQGALRRSDPLYAQAGWLLGRINYIEGRPETALPFYDEVVRTHAGSEYWLAGLVGKAEALAALQRYAASAESYRQAVEALRQFQGSLLIDQQAIRQSLRTLATVLSRENRPQEACPFAEMATNMVPEGQTEPLAELVELQAQIHVQAADALAQAAQTDPMPPARATTEPAGTPPATSQPGGPTEPASASEPAREDPLLTAREHLRRAGELYARLAHIHVLKAPLAQEASWQSARCFDRAGLADEAITALRAFIRDYPSGEYTPEAMHRLGATLQAMGQIDEAIAIYERLLNQFGRTPAAFASLVPLGRCYMALGTPRYDTAEKVLLSIVEEDPAQHPLFTPSAPEFRDALLELANLYMRWDKPERAIERLEQALALYVDDPEITRMQYQLADAYRRSGLSLLADAGSAKQPSQSQALMQEAHRRLERAKDLFDKVASRLDAAPGELSTAEQVYLRTSYIRRADCAFDTGQFAQAADLYGRVAWRWQNDTIALSAYVQIVRSYLAAGEPDAARSALARARWVLRKMADGRFRQPPDFRTREYWTQLFDWVEQSGLLASNGAQ